jgi:hypothetical protein
MYAWGFYGAHNKQRLFAWPLSIIVMFTTKWKELFENERLDVRAAVAQSV